MNELPRRKLLEIVKKQGRSIVENPRRLEGLLRDYCGEYRREISVLVMAVKEHAVLDMMAASASLPRQVLLARLTQRLCDNLAISETAARWSIESWALALGIIAETELKQETEKSVSNQTENNQTVVTNVVQKKPQIQEFIVSPNGGHFKSIREALQKVAPDSRLLVCEGLYNESIVIDKNVEIIGDGEVKNIIVRSVNSSCVLMRTDKARISNLTLEGRGAQTGNSFFAVEIPRGELDLENCDITSDTLSCIAIHGANANPSIKKCLIHDGNDSGFYIFDNARAQIENCDIYRNTNVSVAITTGGNPTLKNCRIFEGKNGGIVAWGNGAAGLIEDCKIYNHRLANIGVREFANPIFRRCEIYGGFDTGIFVHENGYGTFEECNIYQNANAEVGISQNKNSLFRRCAVHDGENSGFIIQNKGRAFIENCNIYNNSDAGAAILGESVLMIKNCNINNNGTVAIRIKEQSTAGVENCDLRGNRIAKWETESGIVLEEENNR